MVEQQRAAHDEFMAQRQIETPPWTRSAAPSPDFPVSEQTHQQVVAELGSLSQTDRIILSLLYFEQLSEVEAAQVMSMSEAEISSSRDVALCILQRRDSRQ